MAEGSTALAADDAPISDWDPSEDRELRMLATAGTPIDEIAERFGRSPHSVRDRFGKIGL